ncbi:Pimeloyl-ACP methyl ester carboxylesterase [Halomicrobium zhouii]|uniref:Pimeloyl-ACP methyl ester carboxylesterase n=1 Tax=Halomicrobium zhouii TaxID=767519 RepID=A0A1I6LYG8_9EURY|nr:alpha/beta hydrolase [Halomicrobium zhouii]SFS08519.1 Pimeloyl-ACP methyl ester carboxylesterase [Halomicrobium zhouii]
MDTVAHDGRTTAFRRTSGAGESVGDATILYVHGSGATHRAWAHQYGPDGPRHPAAAVDLSGHGDSVDVDTDPGPETLTAYVADVTAVARETNADVFVGNSLGGAVVLQAVLDGVVSPSALVLAGTGARLTVHEHLRELLAQDFGRAVDFLHGDDRLFHDAGAETVERSKAEMRNVGQRITRRDFLTCHAFDVRDRLDRIGVPTLAVCGEYDQLTPPEYHEYLADNVWNGQFETVPDAAHLAMVERPDEFDEAVADFLDSVEVV